MAMASVAQSYMLRDLIEPTREWADKALALAEANDFETVRLAAMVEKGSVLVIEPATAAEGVALLQEAADEAERTGDHVLAARALVNLVWQARMTSRFDEARELVQRMRQHAETAGFDSLASYARVEALAALAAADGDLDSALDVLDRGHACRPGARASPQPPLAGRAAGRAGPRGRRPGGGRHVHRGGQARDRPQPRWASWGSMPTWPPARETCLEPGNGSPSCWPSSPRRATHRRPRCTTSWRPSLRAGLDPAELRPFVEAAGIFPGNRLPAGHHTAPAPRRAAGGGRGAHGGGGRPVRRRGRVG